MRFNIPSSQIVGTFSDNYDPNSYRTKYDIALNKKFCCSNSKESYKYTLNSTSESIERKIIFNLKIPIPDDIGISFTIGGSPVKNNENRSNVIISNKNPTKTITYYNNVYVDMTRSSNYKSLFRIFNGIPSESLISVNDKNCFYISQRGNTTYVDYDKCCYQG